MINTGDTLRLVLAAKPKDFNSAGYRLTKMHSVIQVCASWTLRVHSKQSNLC